MKGEVVYFVLNTHVFVQRNILLNARKYCTLYKKKFIPQDKMINKLNDKAY